MNNLLEKLKRGARSSRAQQRKDDKYVDLGNRASTPKTSEVETSVYFSEINGQQDVMNVKDAVYDGDIVVADLCYVASAGLSRETVVEELKTVAGEVNGDIAQRGEDRIVVTPSSVAISRQKL